MAESNNFTTPVGRLVGGSLYEPNTTDYDGKPLVVKSGPNIGKPRVDFSFGVAFPKTPGLQHWSQEPWLAPLWAAGHAAFPNGEAQRADFAWKITDGDSAIPNKRGRKPNEREGYPGHIVVYFGGGYAPRIFNADGSQQILEKDAVKLGYFVQVFGSYSDNKPSASPGMYINHSMVALAAYGPEIIVGPDVSAAGFGAGATLPPGASLAPVGAGAFNPAPPPPVANGVPAYVPPPVANVAPPVAPAYTPPVQAPPPPPVIPVLPNAAILNVPVAPAAPVRQMTALAQGATYEQLIGNGWTDALLIQHGMMLA